MAKRSVFSKRTLGLNIFPTREEMGKAAARNVSLAMKRFIQEKGKVTIVFAAAPSQNEFLAHLAQKKNLDWSRVVCFHLDEYVDLPRHHPNTFEVYLKEHLFNHARPKAIYFMKALKGEAEEISQKYARLIKKSGGLDIACIGIGENGHIAFNEPGSDFYDPQMTRIITLDDRSVEQQYRDYRDHPNPKARYPSLEAVPRRAITLTIPAILSAREIYTIVPGPQKAEAVKKMWEGPIDPSCPSSALRLHRFVKVYLDADSAKDLKKEPSV
ncbi:MAG: glucosamine-6-phosphate deaminase [Deltaproteobacteria bacterium]|nr:glucosamine-6-phosphate deaminase [Deltaproteobacteria bacterium]